MHSRRSWNVVPLFLATAIALVSALHPEVVQAQDAVPAALTVRSGESEIEKIARELVNVENARCMSCHVGDSAHAQEGALLFGVPPKNNGTVRLSPSFIASNHGGMACTTCHVGAFRDYPHTAAPTAMAAGTLDCVECHADKTHRIDAEIAKSVHAANFGASFTCTTCHDPHVMVTGARISDPLALVAQDNAACLSCHASDEVFDAFAATASPATPRPDIDAIHAWLPNRERHWAAVRCIDCHTPAVTEGAHLGVSHQIMGSDDARRDCATCHTVDSVLRTTLYRHLRSTEVSIGSFENAVIAQSSYVIGATRNRTLDLVGIVAVLAVIGGVMAHGLLRWLSARQRGRST